MKHRRPRRKVNFNPATLLLLKQLGYGVLTMAAVALVLTGIWHSTRVEALTITEVKVEGGETIASGTIVAAVEPLLDGNYYHLVPRRFTWWYPKGEIIAAIKAVDRVKDVTIKRVDGQTLLVSFTEYVPEALWCDPVERERCLLLDQAGYAFAPAPILSGGSLVRYYTLQTALERGMVPFTPRAYETTKRFTRYLEDIGWFVAAVEIDAAEDVYYTLVGGGEIKATLLDEPELPFNNLMTLRASTQFAHLAPGNFQYVDARFGSKLFVNEDMAESESAVVAEYEATDTESAVIVPAIVPIIEGPVE